MSAYLRIHIKATVVTSDIPNAIAEAIEIAKKTDTDVELQTAIGNITVRPQSHKADMIEIYRLKHQLFDCNNPITAIDLDKVNDLVNTIDKINKTRIPERG